MRNLTSSTWQHSRPKSRGKGPGAEGLPKIPVLPPIPVGNDAHASATRRRERGAREATGVVTQTMRSATGEWHLSTQIKADMAKLIELGAKSEEQTAKQKFKPFPTKPELPSEMETKERQLRSQMKFLRGCAAAGHVVRQLRHHFWANLPRISQL